MKKIFVLLALFIVVFSVSVSAKNKIKNSLNDECQAFDFSFGIVEWKFEHKEWKPVGDAMSTSVIGTKEEANWDAGDMSNFGMTGVVVKSDKHQYSASGDSGLITEDKKIRSIIFCLTPSPCLPPPPPS